MAERNDLTGEKFNMLTVIEYSHTQKGRAYWKCKCDCENETFANSQNLKFNKVKSCGCLSLKVQQSEDVVRKKTKSYLASCVEGTSTILLNNNIRSNNNSGFRGVSWNKSRGKWYACIGFQGKNINLGLHSDIQDAIKARKIAEEKLWQPILLAHCNTEVDG